MFNLFQLFKSLIPQEPVQIGTVSAVIDGVATVELPGGGLLYARGDASVGVGQRVFVRGGVIESPAPALTYVEAEA